MEHIRTRFWDQGYAVLPNVISSDIVEQVLAEVGSLSYSPTRKVDANDTIDEYRLSTQDISTMSNPALVHLALELNDYVERLDQRWKLQELRILKTLKGSREQCPQRDLDLEVVHKTMRAEQLLQARLVLSLMGASEVIFTKCTDFADTSKREEVYLEPTSCLFYRADLVHLNPASDRSLFTVQASFSVGKFMWPKTTTPIAVSFKLKKCWYCPLLNADALFVHNHMRYCKNNPTLEDTRAKRRQKNKETRECEICGVVFPSQNTFQKHKPAKCVPPSGST